MAFPRQKRLKAALILAFCFFILIGCQRIIKPIEDISENVTGKVQLEQKKQAEKTLAQIKCQELCQAELSTNGQDFEVGPCLSNEIIPDWVCDIAHQPRLPVDNDSANQCPAFRQGQAHHFVELDGNCNLIRTY